MLIKLSFYVKITWSYWFPFQIGETNVRVCVCVKICETQKMPDLHQSISKMRKKWASKIERSYDSSIRKGQWDHPNVFFLLIQIKSLSYGYTYGSRSHTHKHQQSHTKNETKISN